MAMKFHRSLKCLNLKYSACAAALSLAIFCGPAAADTPDRACDNDWRNGPSGHLLSDRFPIGVWLQEPRLAPAYKALGVNLYIGLWNGPTTAQLEELRAANMPVFALPTAAGRDPANADIMAGWLLPDEPDNAQRLPIGVGYGPPMRPREVVELYCDAAAIRPPRPVLLQLGMGVAWEAWKGRGVRFGRMEDYPEYVAGGDIVSFNVYPVTSQIEGVTGRIDLVGVGVDRLKDWTTEDQPAWSAIGLTRIGNPDVLPTPAEIQAQIWTAIIHGARGLVYFVHQFKPDFNAAAILADPAGMAAIKAENSRIQSLAPVLMDGTALPDAATTTSEVDIRAFSHAGKRYVFAVSRTGATSTATIRFQGASTKAFEVFTERQLDLADGAAIVRFPAFAPRIFIIDE